MDKKKSKFNWQNGFKMLGGGFVGAIILISLVFVSSGKIIMSLFKGTSRFTQAAKIHTLHGKELRDEHYRTSIENMGQQMRKGK